MADIAHVIGGDLQLGSSGDLATVDQAAWTEQRVLRRLLTNPGAYIWQLDYGAGLAALIGATVSVQQIAALIRSQLALETAVRQQPEPVITITAGMAGEAFATISYQDATTGALASIALPGAG
ncbi:hypothetical protein [Lichenicoccus sp.]|uniref:hypothetical protein n=1 Tax=Lichenicoccus sp. TaxID=2781899 RepID=UPI003D0BF1FC